MKYPVVSSSVLTTWKIESLLTISKWRHCNPECCGSNPGATDPNEHDHRMGAKQK